MAIGEVKPQEEDDEDYEILEESPSTPPAVNPGESGEKPEDSGIPRNSRESFENSGPPAGESQDRQENEDLIQQETSDPHPRVRQSVQRDHPITTFLEASVEG
jgi:hypothetical protein